MSNIIPATLKEGSKKAANFLSKPMMCMCMVGIGIAITDLADLVAVLNFNTLFISAFVIIGSGVIGMMVGSNFVEAAITAGLCMANRGGSGDLQVLGAAKRMSLMSYAQISSRIGGAIVLVIANFAFGLM
ncbi:2-hydroxycarboxylate transporter family protein [Bengtsoniella intestinalis]|uniref:2-hydroxycarboxylate transporter family protein n=1 Tax=Bengtsoniella intestinalis TaxID=3073143 RepID=UPI00391F5F1F